MAQSGTTLLRGDVEVVNCVRLNAQPFATGIDKHCVPQNKHTEVIGGYAKIFAWELARPRRYITPISYKRMPGQVGWVNLDEQLHIFDNVLLEDINVENTSTDPTQSQQSETQDAKSCFSRGHAHRCNASTSCTYAYTQLSSSCSRRSPRSGEQRTRYRRCRES